MEECSEKPKQKKLWQRSFFYWLILPLAILLLAGLALTGYLYWFFNYRKLPPPPDVEPIRAQLQTGDIVLRSGVGLWSELFRDNNEHDKRFSHVGVALVEPDGECFVIHAEANDTTGSGTVYVMPLADYVRDSDGIGIARLHTLDPAKFAAAVRKYEGTAFDWKFDADDHSSIYCTELVELALQDIAPDASLKRGGYGIIMPESCLDQRYFTEIAIQK